MDEIVKENVRASLVTQEEILTLFQGERRFTGNLERILWTESERQARLAMVECL